MNKNSFHILLIVWVLLILICALVTLVFLILEAANVISWSWAVIDIPIYIAALIAVPGGIIITIIRMSSDL